ncbi:MAG TPA: Uma2 family endonuclease [Oscillatoriaceae cyanobacterium M33_DOE_052]|uniref:Uma2 family endonuclease n=1 Tax=Planktothricoides sp. SpSt-374 TaxID=2282167 RepID=A0A7C3VM82_9CYAN|nr:Uma2 family endonuclease [Oscillatoriaceae cyanobacterium M33_DOE_052]
MYDLPSEDPEEPGLPDEFHSLQPQLLSRTLRLPSYPPSRLFVGSDLNLYYDVHHTLWHKRPDWFLVLDVPRLYEETDLRSSYVVWQEGVNPFLVVELLSPGTEKEDLGEWGAVGDNPATTAAEPTGSNGQSNPETPPGKWDVYERILRVPYYVVFSRYSNRMRGFKLDGGRYREQPINPENPQFWIPEIKLGLGVWSGEYEGINRSWLRWYDAQGNWVPTDVELALAEAERATAEAEQERQKRSQLASKLKSLSPEQLAALGISLEELE